MRIRSHVTDHPAAEPAAAVRHFADRLRFETDCADVAAAIASGAGDFVVVDCRTPRLFALGHIPGAVNIPHRRVDAAAVAALSLDGRMVVTYCNGPHCNASTRGALRFAELGVPVKEMPGGMRGWLHEGLPVEREESVTTKA